MSALTSRRAAERFARVIDLDVPPPMLSGGDAAMRPVVSLTAALRSAARTSAPAPLSAETRLAMRQRLVAAASAPAEASLLSPGIATRVNDAASRVTASSRRFGRRAAALVGSIVLVTSVSGVGVAAARSLPGSPFYDLKRATEHVQLWLASGPAAKGERHLEFAQTRLAEARALGADSSYLSSTLRAMNQETRVGSADMIQAYRANGDSDPLAHLVTFTRRQYTGLVRFGNAAGVQVQAQTFYSLTLLAGVAQQVESVSGTTCLTCIVNGTVPRPGPLPVGSTSPSPARSGGAPTPRSTPSSGGSPARPTPSSLLPTNLLPTGLPTKLPTLPPLLQRHDGKGSKPTQALPTLSPIPLLSTLTKLFSSR